MRSEHDLLVVFSQHTQLLLPKKGEDGGRRNYKEAVSRPGLVLVP